MIDHILTTACAAARAAGAHILAAAEDVASLEIEHKSRFDYVSRIDRESELMIRERVENEFPQHGFMGEEYGGGGELAASDYLWVVDPLDGTTNFLRNIPHYAVSIAVVKDGSPVVGVVYDPGKDELFSAAKGSGSFLNDLPLAKLHTDSFQGSLLATGVPFSGQNLAEIDAFTNTMTDLLQLGTSGIRRLGSAALDLAYVAAARYDGYWEANLKPWDIAAGVLLVQEAGGAVGDFSGEQGYLTNGDVIAGPEVVYSEMLRTVRRNYLR